MKKPQKGPGLRCALYATGDPEEGEFKTQVENQLHREGIALSMQTYNVNDALSQAVDLENIDVVLLLVSPLFPRAYFAHQDMLHLLQKQQAGSICVIPILVRPTFWYDLPFARIPALPHSEREGVKPLSLWRNRDLAISQVVADIKAITSEFEQIVLQRFSRSLDALVVRLTSHPSDKERQDIAEQLFSACQRIIPFSSQTAGELFFQLGEIASQLEDNYALAQRCYEQGIELCQQVFGPTSKETVQNLRGLVKLHQQHEQFEKAEDSTKQLLHIYAQLKPESEDRFLLAIILYDKTIGVITTEVPQTINILLAIVAEKLSHPLREYQPSLETEAEGIAFLRQIFEGVNVSALCLFDTNDDIAFISFEADPEKAREMMRARLNQYLQN